MGEAAERERRLHGIFESMGEGVLLFGRDGSLLHMNAAAERILQCNRAEVGAYDFGVSRWRAWRADGSELAVAERPTRRAIREKKTVKARSLRVKTPIGTDAWIDVSASPFVDNAGNMQGLVVTFADVSDRLAMEQALRESEENFRALAENAKEAILAADATGKTVYANRYASALTGYTNHELQGMKIGAILAPGEKRKVARLTRRRLEGKAVTAPYESVLLTRDRRHIPVEITGSRTLWQGRPATLGMLRDISERKKADQALRESESTYHKTIDALEAAVHVVDAELRVVVVNRFFQNWCRQLGIPGNLIGQKLSTVFPFLKPDVLEEYRWVLESGKKLRTHEKTRVDGRDIVTETTKIPLMEKGRVTRIITMIRDVTEKRRMENEILDISQREQRRIGQTLHDSLGQELAGIAFLAKALEVSLQSKALPEAEDAVRLVGLIEGALKQTRTIARGISPVDVVAEGLGEALRQLAETTREVYGVRCTCRISRASLVHDNAVATHLYHIAQEAVHNALRHGKPSKIGISLYVRNRSGRLVIKDDGKGLPKRKNRRPGMGLRIMHYRAEMITGNLRVVNNEQGGVTLACAFEDKPLPESA